MENTMYGFKKLPALREGKHGSPEEGMCIMELVSFINREEFSDFPGCTYRRISRYMQNVNDSVLIAERVKLLSVIDRMFHTGEISPEELDMVDEKLVAELWPDLPGLLTTHAMTAKYIDYEPFERGLWGFLYVLSSSGESVDVKLQVLNRVLDIMDEVMGVKEILPQNRAEIEKMLAGVQG